MVRATLQTYRDKKAFGAKSLSGVRVAVMFLLAGLHRPRHRFDLEASWFF
jgi:hypothetical protein